MLRACFALEIALAAPALAGPLTPPAGPVAPTDTALRQTDTRIPINDVTAPQTAGARHRISSSGSYYLTDDIVVAANGQSGIEVLVANVTIDLNGYDIVGGSLFVTSSANGIDAAQGLTVRNGVIRDFTLDAIQGDFDDLMVVENVLARNNGGGIVVGDSSRVIDCRAFDNGDNGIDAGNSSVVYSCVAQSNDLDGIIAGNAAVVSHCTASGNGSDGILALENALIQSCVARDNGTDGIQIFGSGAIYDCVSERNDDGFRTDGSTHFSRCHASRNTESGFVGASGSSFDDCMASLNKTGFLVNEASVTNCTARNNTNVGIQATSDCSIVGNYVTGGPGAPSGDGIRATGTRNLIDSNAVIANGDDGITVVINGGNLVVRNRSAQNGGANFAIPTGNPVGPIAIVSGVDNIDAVPFASHPQANLEY